MRLDDHEDCLADRHEGISLAANGQKEGRISACSVRFGKKS